MRPWLYAGAVAVLALLTDEEGTMSPLAYAKALVGALVAALTALGTGLTDGSMTAAEWVAVALAAVVAFGAVFTVPNQQPVDPDA